MTCRSVTEEIVHGKHDVKIVREKWYEKRRENLWENQRENWYEIKAKNGVKNVAKVTAKIGVKIGTNKWCENLKACASAADSCFGKWWNNRCVISTLSAGEAEEEESADVLS